MSLDIKLDMRVVITDSKVIGKVDRLVIDPESHELEEIIIHKGVLQNDRIIERVSIESVDPDKPST